VCGFNQLYEWQNQQDRDKVFTLHDGPPYANGKTHVGHLINKVLKDIANRYYLLQGYKVQYVPGWDCHGLPIEQKALSNKDMGHLTPLQIRQKARQFAKEAIKDQMQSFQRWGIMADWDKQTYFTFDAHYQAEQLEIFYQMYEKGYVYQSFMPVYWSPSSKTALAEAELEYNQNHVSTAAYVSFPVTSIPALSQFTGSEIKLFAVIWTTTPWTLPANQAICYAPQLKYTIARDMETDKFYICGEIFLEKLKSLCKGRLEVISTVKGEDLQGGTYSNPLALDPELPFLPGSHVSEDMGTALVHTAPAHGPEDFSLAIDHDIKPVVLVDENGQYTSEAGSSLAGLNIGDEADKAVLSMLGENVIHSEAHTHSYPYDWRTKKPVILRASKQWFVNTKLLTDKAVAALKKTKIVPSSLENSMISMLESRKFWCISRQRVWGVPIPVFYHKETGEKLLERDTVDHIKSLILENGSDVWWRMSEQELLPEHVLKKYGSSTSADYVKGQDILDIWFDSGTSWAAVLPEGLQADVYLEGVDQFKGWFQSSLLTSLATKETAPYKSIVVHGFSVDEEGLKMSKSVGNVIDPDVVINGGKNKKTHPAYGVDVLRLWAAHYGLQNQVRIGANIIQKCNEDLFQIRKILRLLLGNLSNYSHRDLPVSYEDLWPQDKYMLCLLYDFDQKVKDYYREFEFGKILFATENLLNTTLSRFYLNITKDRLYCSNSESPDRQSCQFVLYHTLHVITKCLAPIVPHLMEEVYQYFPCRDAEEECLFKSSWYNIPKEWKNVDIEFLIGPVLQIQDTVISSLETPGDFDVTLVCSGPLHNVLQVRAWYNTV
ncbi:hypothetical protein FSP39_018556, partial [Pinctada imbricata]